MENSEYDVDRLKNLGEAIAGCQPREKQANIIDELHANENAHSRILRMLLQYKDEERGYWIFKSFLNIAKIREVFVHSVDEPIFENEQDRIDLLVYEKRRKYAIIVENKIFDAKDRKRQIERYIDRCKHKVKSDKTVYVIYLTRDGSKEVSDISLTQASKEALDNLEDDRTGRFISLNYRYDILPWLEKEILPNCTVNDLRLLSAIHQYVDYLKGLFGLRLDFDNIYMEEKRILMENGVESLRDCENLLAEQSTLRDAISHYMDAMVRDIAEKYLFGKIEKELNIELTSKSASFGYLKIAVPVPDLQQDAYFSVDTENGRLYYGLVYNDAEKKGSLKERFMDFWRNKQYRSSDWWPCWKWMDRSYNPGTSSFWEELLENSEFANEVLALYDEICKYVKECP